MVEASQTFSSKSEVDCVPHCVTNRHGTKLLMTLQMERFSKIYIVNIIRGPSLLAFLLISLTKSDDDDPKTTKSQKPKRKEQVVWLQKLLVQAV